MMIAELQPHEFARVLPLYRATAACFPLISAVIQEKQRGWIFADERENPRSAVVVTAFGFMFLAGFEESEAFDAGLAELIKTGGGFKPTYVLWYSPPANWQSRLDAVGPDLVRKRERVRFEFRAEDAGWMAEPRKVPAEFELRSLSFDLIPKTEKFGIKLDSRFWASAADFVENGLGVCLLKDCEVVSLCYAAAVVDGLAEVDVATEEEFRGRGLAAIVGQEFIRQCWSRRIVPTWDCFVANVGSMKLALRLGFAPVSNYPLYSFNVPVKL
jgi:RimJ/RimL family protein N-acetyltransferase